MQRFTDAGALNPQWDEVVNNAIDKRQFAEVVTDAANLEYAVEHGFGTVPLGFIVIKQDKAAVTYSGPTPWDLKNIYVQTSVDHVTLRMLIF